MATAAKVVLAALSLCFFVVVFTFRKTQSLSLYMNSYIPNNAQLPPQTDDTTAAKYASSIPILQALSNPTSFLQTVSTLYSKYGHEIRHFRHAMKRWCLVYKNCKFTDFEVEMLYMLIREVSPLRVFEMAPNRGFSTHWILQALALNNDTDSRLYSYDLHNASLSAMKNPVFQQKWIFTLGDYKDLLQQGQLDMSKFDFIFIDALHTEEFSRAYCRDLLLPLRQKAVVAIHDIVADRHGGGRESAEVYKYIAFAPNIQNVFTMSRFGMPSMYTPIEDGIEQVHKLRASLGIVKPCNETTRDCKKALYDPLYFENNDAPTLFFQIN